MTENEFVRLCTVDFIDNQGKAHRGIEDVARTALQIAKNLGAKFDPEPADLPTLGIYRKHSDMRIYGIRAEEGSMTGDLSEEQAREIIRRCRVVSVLREFLKPYTSVTTRAVLDILDGKMVGSRSVEGGHAF